MATWSTPDNKELSSGFFVIRLFSAKKGCIWQKDMEFNILLLFFVHTGDSGEGFQNSSNVGSFKGANMFNRKKSYEYLF